MSRTRNKQELASDPVELLHGPYEPPPCRPGDLLEDEVLGLIEVGGLVATPIGDWPRRRKTGRAALIVTSELARALRSESAMAVARHWSVSSGTVWAWRQALGVGPFTEGTRALLRERTGVPLDAAARGREAAKTPAVRAKRSATKKGRPAGPSQRAALLRAASAPKPEGWGRRANKWMLAAKGITVDDADPTSSDDQPGARAR